MAGQENETVEIDEDYEIVKSELMNNPNKSFGMDLVFFLSREYEVGWSPPGILRNLFNVLGKFTHDIQAAAMIVLRHREAEIQSHFENLIKPPAVVDIFPYYEYCGKVVVGLLESSDPCPKKYFETVVYIARLSLLFYQRGVAGAPEDAARVIHNIMSLFDEEIDFYPLFSSYASKLIERSENDA